MKNVSIIIIIISLCEIVSYDKCVMEARDEKKIKFIIGYGISRDYGYGDETYSVGETAEGLDL